MKIREPQAWPARLGPLNIAVFLTGTALLLVGLSFDWVHLLKIVRFPAGELNNPWVRADLATLRGVCVVIATFFIISSTVVWRSPQVIAALSNKIEIFIATAAHSPLFMPLALMTLVLMKSVLQLGLYSLDIPPMAPTISRVH